MKVSSSEEFKALRAIYSKKSVSADKTAYNDENIFTKAEKQKPKSNTAKYRKKKRKPAAPKKSIPKNSVPELRFKITPLLFMSLVLNGIFSALAGSIFK